jgi:hypothetical protein
MVMKPWHKEVILFILAAPISAVVALVRLIRRLRLLWQAMQPSLPCRTCGEQIALVGFWQCSSCKHTYQGHVLRFCQVCGTFPRMVRCYRCGATHPVRG